MWLSAVAKYARLTWLIFRANLASALSFPFSFILYFFGIMIYFGGQFFLWIVFFNQFPMVGGWTSKDMILVYSLYTFSLAVLDVFAGGVSDLAKIINVGDLDYYLTLPKPVLWHVSVSKADVASAGTLVLSVGFYLFSGPFDITRTLLFLLASGFSIVLLFNFFVLAQSVAFFIGGFEQGASALRHLIATVSPYPFGVFAGPFKYLLMTFVPSFFIVTLPARLVDGFSVETLLNLIAACVVSSFIAYVVFTKGLKRYESGNLVSVKM